MNHPHYFLTQSPYSLPLLPPHDFLSTSLCPRRNPSSLPPIKPHPFILKTHANIFILAYLRNVSVWQAKNESDEIGLSKIQDWESPSAVSGGIWCREQLVMWGEEQVSLLMFDKKKQIFLVNSFPIPAFLEIQLYDQNVLALLQSTALLFFQLKTGRLVSSLSIPLLPSKLISQRDSLTALLQLQINAIYITFLKPNDLTASKKLLVEGKSCQVVWRGSLELIDECRIIAQCASQIIIFIDIFGFKPFDSVYFNEKSSLYCWQEQQLAVKQGGKLTVKQIKLQENRFEVSPIDFLVLPQQLANKKCSFLHLENSWLLYFFQELYDSQFKLTLHPIRKVNIQTKLNTLQSSRPTLSQINQTAVEMGLRPDQLLRLLWERSKQGVDELHRIVAPTRDYLFLSRSIKGVLKIRNIQTDTVIRLIQDLNLSIFEASSLEQLIAVLKADFLALKLRLFTPQSQLISYSLFKRVNRENLLLLFLEWEQKDEKRGKELLQSVRVKAIESFQKCIQWLIDENSLPRILQFSSFFDSNSQFWSKVTPNQYAGYFSRQHFSHVQLKPLWDPLHNAKWLHWSHLKKHRFISLSLSQLQAKLNSITKGTLYYKFIAELSKRRSQQVLKESIGILQRREVLPGHLSGRGVFYVKYHRVLRDELQIAVCQLEQFLALSQTEILFRVIQQKRNVLFNQLKTFYQQFGADKYQLLIFDFIRLNALNLYNTSYILRELSLKDSDFLRANRNLLQKVLESLIEQLRFTDVAWAKTIIDYLQFIQLDQGLQQLAQYIIQSLNFAPFFLYLGLHLTISQVLQDLSRLVPTIMHAYFKMSSHALIVYQEQQIEMRDLVSVLQMILEINEAYRAKESRPIIDQFLRELLAFNCVKEAVAIVSLEFQHQHNYPYSLLEKLVLELMVKLLLLKLPASKVTPHLQELQEVVVSPSLALTKIKAKIELFKQLQGLECRESLTMPPFDNLNKFQEIIMSQKFQKIRALDFRAITLRILTSELQLLEEVDPASRSFRQLQLRIRSILVSRLIRSACWQQAHQLIQDILIDFPDSLLPLVMTHSIAQNLSQSAKRSLLRIGIRQRKDMRRLQKINMAVVEEQDPQRRKRVIEEEEERSVREEQLEEKLLITRLGSSKLEEFCDHLRQISQIGQNQLTYLFVNLLFRDPNQAQQLFSLVPHPQFKSLEIALHQLFRQSFVNLPPLLESWLRMLLVQACQVLATNLQQNVFKVKLVEVWQAVSKLRGLFQQGCGPLQKNFLTKLDYYKGLNDLVCQNCLEALPLISKGFYNYKKTLDSLELPSKRIVNGLGFRLILVERELTLVPKSQVGSQNDSMSSDSILLGQLKPLKAKRTTSLNFLTQSNKKILQSETIKQQQCESPVNNQRQVKSFRELALESQGVDEMAQTQEQGLQVSLQEEYVCQIKEATKPKDQQTNENIQQKICLQKCSQKALAEPLDPLPSLTKTHPLQSFRQSSFRELTERALQLLIQFPHLMNQIDMRKIKVLQTALRFLSETQLGVVFPRDFLQGARIEERQFFKGVYREIKKGIKELINQSNIFIVSKTFFLALGLNKEFQHRILFYFVEKLIPDFSKYAIQKKSALLSLIPKTFLERKFCSLKRKGLQQSLLQQLKVLARLQS